ncbi:MAG: nucleotidyl transferase AbiEii/AbiGii toxin family protein [Bdellovibrionaceae bacterium]|jgi:predicted nucleotidyltransferase component of viral defense system|nr:nucleotidyl transferase AbiEii/AbiGii toxin family protein [Pseudobdellovibrionaceae bacterium]
MNKFIKLSPKEKMPYFIKAASDCGLPEQIIEKDFWVCWLLSEIFSLDEIGDYLTFKGGTSLSKAYNVIRRFSEDIDISIEKSYLGFTGDKDPKQSTSSKKAKSLIKEITLKCSEFVENRLIEELHSSIDRKLSSKNGHSYNQNTDWKLVVDEDNPDTLLFHYPVESNKYSYIKPIVRIEMGARADHQPVEVKKIEPYVSQNLSKEVFNSDIEIQVLSVERTFWEKATILHMYANYPASKDIPIRQSRHFYDFYCLLQSNAKEKALASIELLGMVTEHKKLYFKSSWAGYESAKKGTLKLIPESRILQMMKDDYIKMNEMFFDDPIEWEVITSNIKLFEEDFNNTISGS